MLTARRPRPPFLGLVYVEENGLARICEDLTFGTGDAITTYGIEIN